MKTWIFVCVWLLLGLVFNATLAVASPVRVLDATEQRVLQQNWHRFSADYLESPIASIASDALLTDAAFPWRACFDSAARQTELPLALLLAVARGESSFDPNVVSSAHAIGVMQIQWPGTAHHLGIFQRRELFDPCTNIHAGARYLRELIDQFGSLHVALAAYNYGPGRIARTQGRLPSGAIWYSSYIYQHLQSVISPATPPARAQAQRIALIEFAEPFRAMGFVRQLQQAQSDLQFEWFRNSRQRYTVAAHVASEAERERIINQLQRLGFAR